MEEEAHIDNSSLEAEELVAEGNQGAEGEQAVSDGEEESDEESTSDEEEGSEDEEEEDVDEAMDENEGEDDDDDDEEEEEDEESEDEDALQQPAEVEGAEGDSSGDENCDQCPICLNRLRQQDVGMPECCDHVFCLECIQLWSKNVNTCPVDRQVFHIILAKHAGEDKVYAQFPVENRQELEVEEDEVQEDDTVCEVCEEEPLQQGRQIARTRVSERVRRIIADARAARAERRRIVAQRIADRDSFMDEDPTPGPSSSSTPRRGTKRKRTTRRKTTKKRKTTTKKKKVPKKGTAGKRKKKRRKLKRKSRTAKKTAVSSAASSGTSPALARTAQTSVTVKGRIADRLGIKPPPRGRSMPTQKAPASGQTRGASRYEAAPSFSILGAKDELYSFAEEEGEERVPVNRPAIPASTLSRSALHSHRPLGHGRIAHSRRPAVTPTPGVTSPQAATTKTSTADAAKVNSIQSAPASSSFDLLGSIMTNQDLLAKSSRHITIQRDGSLTAASSSLEIHAAARKIKLARSSDSSSSVASIGNAGDNATASSTASVDTPSSIGNAGDNATASSTASVDTPSSASSSNFCNQPEKPMHENVLPSLDSLKSQPLESCGGRGASDKNVQSLTALPNTTALQSHSTSLLKPRVNANADTLHVHEHSLKTDVHRLSELSNNGDNVKVNSERQNKDQADPNSGRDKTSRTASSEHADNKGGVCEHHSGVSAHQSGLQMSNDNPEQQKQTSQHKPSHKDHQNSTLQGASRSKEKRRAVSSHINNHINSPLDSTTPTTGDKTCSDLESSSLEGEIPSTRDTTECEITGNAETKNSETKQEIESTTGMGSGQELTYTTDLKGNSLETEKESSFESNSKQCENNNSESEKALQGEISLTRSSSKDNSAQSNETPNDDRHQDKETLSTVHEAKEEQKETPEYSHTHLEEKFYNSTSNILKREILERETFAESFSRQEEYLNPREALDTSSFLQMPREEDRGWSDDHIIYEEAGWGDYSFEGEEELGCTGYEKNRKENLAVVSDYDKKVRGENVGEQGKKMDVDNPEARDGNDAVNSTDKPEVRDGNDGVSSTEKQEETFANSPEDLLETDGALDNTENIKKDENCHVEKLAAVVKEEGEASDSGEEGEVRDENPRDLDGDYEEGEIVDEDETDYQIRKQKTQSDQHAVEKSAITSASAALPTESDQAKDTPLAEENKAEITGEIEQDKKEEEIEEEDDEEELEESSEEDDYDPDNPINANFTLGAFLASVRSNEFDRKKEKAARREAIRLRKEEKEKREEAEKLAKQNAKISIYDFIGSSAKKFGVFVPTPDPKKEEAAEPTSKGKGRGTKPVTTEVEQHAVTHNSYRPRAAPWGDREKGGRELRHDRPPTSPDMHNSEPSWRDKEREYPMSFHNSRGRGRMPRNWNTPGQFHPHSSQRHRRRHSRSPPDGRDHHREKRLQRQRSRSPQSTSVHRESRRGDRRRARRRVPEAEEQKENNSESSNSESSDDEKRAEGRRRNAARGHKRSKRKWGRYSSEMNGSVSSEGESDDSGSSNDEAGRDNGEPEVDSDEEVLAKRTSPIHIPAPPLPASPSPQSARSPMSPPSPPAYSPVGPASPVEPPPPPPSPPRPKQQSIRPVQKVQEQHLHQQHQQQQQQQQHSHPHPQQHSQQYSQAYHQHQAQQQQAAQSSQSQAQYAQRYPQHPHYSQQYAHAYPQYSQRPGQTSQYPAHPAVSASQYSYPHPHSAYPRGQAPPAANSRAAPSGHPAYHYYPSQSTVSAQTSGHQQPAATSYQHSVPARPGYPPYSYQYAHPGYSTARHPYQVASAAPGSTSQAYPHSQQTAAYQAAVAARSASASTTATARAAYPVSGYTAQTSHNPSGSVQTGLTARTSHDINSRFVGRVASPPSEMARPTRVSSYRISPSEPSFKGVPTSDRIASNLLLDEVKKGFRQLVEDAVRSALKPAWNAKKVTKDEYKDIFKRAVDKVCGSKETVVQQDKIQYLVEAYVAKARKTRTS
ncbi:PHD and RING finger domain-containing protein 1 [Elysia marginata]|uniref:PHD and RING finger domain-containing protein 1 n=1 Tax=Elysia marginata TaxID=1093978 RepID=A0AAV4G3Q7_9GAST|nr:PHD and RING finger domain-containing protein 1 [Elysia marginata]